MTNLIRRHRTQAPVDMLFVLVVAFFALVMMRIVI